jgi:hypothetical protein
MQVGGALRGNRPAMQRVPHRRIPTIFTALTLGVDGVAA